MHVYKGKAKGGDHRCTPPEIWMVALAAVGIKAWDLDPATNAFSTVPATVCWDGSGEDQDGLILPWYGHVWLNFPFSVPALWVDKAIAEAASRVVRSITILSPSDSSTAWWHKLRRGCDASAAWSRRTHFPLPDNPKGSPGAAPHLSYIGKRSNRWRRVFERYGHTTCAGSIS